MSLQQEEPTAESSPELEILEDEALLENEEQSLAASSLLVTGGHSTYVNGYAGALFKPDNVMTRAEVAKMLYNLLAAKPAVTQSQFSDVKLSAWYGTAVNALAKVGVLSGYKDGTFMPNKTITRAEFVKAVSACFSLNAGAADFTDVPSTHWAYPAVAAATNAGWINGLSNGEFQPERGIKRCEAVKVMNAALERTGEGFAADRDVQKFVDVSKNHWAYLQISEAGAPVDGGTAEPEEPTEEGNFKVGQNVQVSVDNGLNLRAEPTTDSSAVDKIAKGTVLTVTDISAYPWIGVKTSSGVSGYVHSGNNDGWYIVDYVPQASASGLTLSAATLSMRQYQSARLDAAVASGDLRTLSWSSSNSNVATVGYTVGYGSGSSKHGAFVYAKQTGTAVLTLSDSTGAVKASCTVTVSSPESVRYAYAGENTALTGAEFELVAVTDTSRSAVTFKIIEGPATGTFTTETYTTESHQSKYGLPTNTVKVFKRKVSFTAAGLYIIRASANNFSDYQEFKVLIRPEGESVTQTSFNERLTSTEGLDIIANFEGAVPEIADDSIATGNPTVGYGFVVRQNECFYNNMTTSELRGKLVDAVNNNGYSAAVNSFRKSNNLKMSQAQFDALVSFVYNCGTGSLDASKYDTFKVMLNAVAPPSGGISESRSYPGKINVSQYQNYSGSSVCNLYTEASLSAKVVVAVPEGADVTVIGTHSVAAKCQYWYKVRYGSNTGWIPAGYVQLDASGLTHDLAYIDATVFSNNFMQWHKSGSSHYYGLLTRRLAECKIFFFGNYAEAYHSNANYGKNNCGFVPPSCCADELD